MDIVNEVTSLKFIRYCRPLFAPGVTHAMSTVGATGLVIVVKTRDDRSIVVRIRESVRLRLSDAAHTIRYDRRV